MGSVNFQSASRIISQVFQWFQSSSQNLATNFIMDSFQSGVDNATPIGEGFTLVPGAASLTVTVVGPGIAYDPTGARIYVSSTDTTVYNVTNPTTTTNDGLGNLILTPQSTGVVNVPLSGNSINYLWINYLAVTDITAYTLQKITKAKIFYKLTDGYNIQVTTVNTPPNANSIFLGTIDLTGITSGIISSSTITQTGRSYFRHYPKAVGVTTALADRSNATAVYNPASNYSLDDHIKGVGTGTVSSINPHGLSLVDLGGSALDTVTVHRQLEHGNAIIAGTAGNSYPSTSAMACQIVLGTSDYILVKQLLTSEVEVALINGTGYNVNAIFGATPTDAVVNFPNVSGTYSVYWNSTTAAFGVTLTPTFTDTTKLWLCTVTYTYVGVLGHNTLTSLVELRRIGSTVEKYQRWVTTARPPSPLPGEYGFNLDINAPEWYDGASWNSLSVPTGTVLDFAGPTAPVGFLANDGASYSTTAYANLFGIIGYTYGGSGGSFNVPNKARRVSVGAGGAGTGTLGNTVGSTGGTETVTPVVNITDPTHHHITPDIYVGGQIAMANPDPYGTTTVSVANDVYAGAGSGGGPGNQSLGNTSSSSTGITAASTSTNIIQPSIVFLSIIKY